MITSNLRAVMGEIDKYKAEVVTETKATRDELARTAQTLMKKELSHRHAYKGRGKNKTYIPTGDGEPPAKVTGTLYRNIKVRKWTKAGQQGATVGLIYKGRRGGYGDAFYGVILESSNRSANGGYTPKRRNFKDGRTIGKKYPQRAPGVHKWALPAFNEFEPLVKPITNKHLLGGK